MKWNVCLYNEAVRKVYNKFPPEAKVIVLRTIELLKTYGPYNSEIPHTKHWEKDIWEIIANSPDTWNRVFYCSRERNIWLLHSFNGKQTKKTPSKDAEIARKRAREVKKL